MAKSFWAVLVLLAGTTSLLASDKYLEKEDGSGKSSLVYWNHSIDNKNPPTSDNDYFVTGGLKIRAPKDRYQKFGGNSLTLDNATFIPYPGTNEFPSAGLILKNGHILPYSANMFYMLKGLVDVRSPASAPFDIELTDNNKDHLGDQYMFAATFKGEAGTGFKVVNRYENPNGLFVLQPSSDTTFAGTLTIGPVPGADETVERHSVRCELRGSPTWPGTLWVTQYATMTPQFASTQWKIGTLRLDAGSTWAVKLTNNSQANTTTLTDGLTTAYPVNLTFTEGARPVNSGMGFIWDILTLPKAKKEMIHPEHFKLVTQEAVGLFPDAFPSVELRVAERGDLAVLELVQRQVVQNTVEDDPGYGYSKQSFEFPTSMTNAMAWSNKNLPMPTIDYIAANNLNAATPSQCEDGVYTFPGASLTVKSGVTFCEAAHEFTIPVLCLESNARFWPLGEQYDDATAVVKGRIHVLKPTSDNYALLRVRRQSTVDIEAELTGTGNLQVQPNANDSTDSVAVLDHNNSAFLGKIRIQSNTYTNDMFTKGQTLVLKAANNVGGPLDAPAADALEIRYFSTLEVTNDVVFATVNRGLTVNNAQIKVGKGATFTFANDITYAGPLVKVGAGRLVLGGTALGSKKTLTVEEGTLAVSTDTALDGVGVTFTGGALAVNPATAGEYGMRGPFSGNLPVAFDLPAGEEPYEYSNVAVCTVGASANMTPKAVRIPRHRVVFHWRDNDDGTKTLLADISRAGLAIILR